MTRCFSRKILSFILIIILAMYVQLNACSHYPKLLVASKQINKENIQDRIYTLQAFQSLFGKSR
jgi:uncharacterized membrane protein